MLTTLCGLLKERAHCFCVSRNLHSVIDDGYSEKEQREAERRYRDLGIIIDKLITKIRIHIVENSDDILYEKAKEIFR